MWVEVSVLYRGALTHYSILQLSDGSFVAKLVGYKGRCTPPEELFFREAGRHCEGSTEETELLDDLYLAYQHKQRNWHH